MAVNWIKLKGLYKKLGSSGPECNSGVLTQFWLLHGLWQRIVSWKKAQISEARALRACLLVLIHSNATWKHHFTKSSIKEICCCCLPLTPDKICLVNGQNSNWSVSLFLDSHMMSNNKYTVELLRWCLSLWLITNALFILEKKLECETWVPLFLLWINIEWKELKNWQSMLFLLAFVESHCLQENVMNWRLKFTPKS